MDVSGNVAVSGLVSVSDYVYTTVGYIESGSTNIIYNATGHDSYTRQFLVSVSKNIGTGTTHKYSLYLVNELDNSAHLQINTIIDAGAGQISLSVVDNNALQLVDAGSGYRVSWSMLDILHPQY